MEQATKDRWLDLLDEMESAGREARKNPGKEPTDQQLVDLAGDLADKMGHPELLEGGAHPDMLVDLHDAFREGRRPDVLDFDQVVDELRNLGVPAAVLHTSGGTATLYAGRLDDSYDADDPRRYPVSMGPGNFEVGEGRHSEGNVTEIGAGPTRHDGPGYDIGEWSLPTEVAAAIATLVQEEQD